MKHACKLWVGPNPRNNAKHLMADPHRYYLGAMERIALFYADRARPRDPDAMVMVECKERRREERALARANGKTYVE